MNRNLSDIENDALAGVGIDPGTDMGWFGIGSGAGRDESGTTVRGNGRMYLPLLTQLSNRRSTPIPDDRWPATVEAALAGDPAAIEDLFAAGSRWANRIIHSRPWLDDAEADVIALMWTTLPARPKNSDDWRTLVRRRLTRREYRPTVEAVWQREWLEERADTVSDIASGVVEQLSACSDLAALGPFPAGVRRYLTAVLNDTAPSPQSAHSARQWRYLRRQADVA